jgi:hypothetical protein
MLIMVAVSPQERDRLATLVHGVGAAKRSPIEVPESRGVKAL